MKTPIRFDEYYLIERIAVGGMAEVFQGVTYNAEGFERQMAVKRVLPHIAEDREFIEMFIDEAKLVSQLQHPNIPQIYHLGKHEEQYFISMEYVSGKDLRSIFDRARTLGVSLDLGHCVHIVMEVCEALDYAHRKTNDRQEPLNLIHRDVSPQNVIVGYDGTVKLIDFGIAKATGQMNQTRAGILKGKFSYMSPEQARGYPIDARSDLFGLGAVLYEIVTLERCFLGQSDFSTIERVRNVEYQAPQQLRRHLPQPLERVMRRALAKDPDERFQSAMDLQETLRQVGRSHNLLRSRDDLRAMMKQLFPEEIHAEKQRLIDFRAYAAQHIPQAQGRHESRRFRKVAPEDLNVEVSRPRFALRDEMKLSLEAQDTATLDAPQTPPRREREHAHLLQQTPAIATRDLSQSSSSPLRFDLRSMWGLFLLVALFIGSFIVAVMWNSQPLLSTLWIDDPRGWGASFKLSGEGVDYQGNAPAVIDQLNTGAYTITFTSLEGRQTPQELFLGAGDERHVSPPELHELGKVSLYISSNPLGAEVLINQRPYGKTPFELVLPQKRFTLKMRALGYVERLYEMKPQSRAQEASANRALHFDLMPLKVEWSIKTGLNEAEVELKESATWRRLGRGDLRVKLSNQERSYLRIRAEGYHPLEFHLDPVLQPYAQRVVALKPITAAHSGTEAFGPSSQPKGISQGGISDQTVPQERSSETQRALSRSKTPPAESAPSSVAVSRRSKPPTSKPRPRASPQRRATPRARPTPRATRRQIPQAGGQPGFLKLVAFPPAEVFIQGKRVGWTPLINYKLNEGMHQIKLRFRSGEERVISQSISAGRVTLRRVKK